MATINLNVKTQRTAYDAGQQAVISALLEAVTARASSQDLLDVFESMLNAEQREQLDAAYNNRR